MGCKSGGEIDSPLGWFELNHTHESGLRFLTYLAVNKVATMSFKKKTLRNVDSFTKQETTSDWPFYS